MNKADTDFDSPLKIRDFQGGKSFISKGGIDTLPKKEFNRSNSGRRA